MDVKEHIKTGGYIFQRKVVQWSEMDRLNKSAINTLRIITINRNGEPYVLSSLLRVGTSKTGNVNNWAAGGLVIEIDGDRYLKEYGFYKPCHGLKACTHPDSGISFEEYKVSSLDDAYAIACRVRKMFYDVRKIGWDIAITEDGPIFKGWKIILKFLFRKRMIDPWKNNGLKQWGRIMLLDKAIRMTYFFGKATKFLEMARWKNIGRTNSKICVGGEVIRNKSDEKSVNDFYEKYGIKITLPYMSLIYKKIWCGWKAWF